MKLDTSKNIVRRLFDLSSHTYTLVSGSSQRDIERKEVVLINAELLNMAPSSHSKPEQCVLEEFKSRGILFVNFETSRGSSANVYYNYNPDGEILGIKYSKNDGLLYITEDYQERGRSRWTLWGEGNDFLLREKQESSLAPQNRTVALINGKSAVIAGVFPERSTPENPPRAIVFQKTA